MNPSVRNYPGVQMFACLVRELTPPASMIVDDRFAGGLPLGTVIMVQTGHQCNVSIASDYFSNININLIGIDVFSISI